MYYEAKIKRATKDAIMGLVGDNVKEIAVPILYSRVDDQCKRTGIYTPSWARFIDVCRDIGIKFPDVNVAVLPSKKVDQGTKKGRTLDQMLELNAKGLTEIAEHKIKMRGEVR